MAPTRLGSQLRPMHQARPMRPSLVLLPVVLLAACAQPVRQEGRAGRAGYDWPVPYDGTDPAAEGRAALSRNVPRRFYAPPGAGSDPWGPYIHEAAQRFRVPEQWVRAVMHQESGDQEQVVSSAGAMGLMQVMPATYAGLRDRHKLGADPFEPHDNILAGVAYIREMYDRFGAPGFLAAYNAGPDRLDFYLNGGGSLPDETVNYLAAITPHLGTEVAFSGPLAQYAGGRAAVQPAAFAAAPTPASFAAGCDTDAAYDPDQPCAPLIAASVAPDPPRATLTMRAAAYQPVASAPLAAGPRGWAIQVGAFNSVGLARMVAEGARSEAPAQLAAAALDFPVVSAGKATLYRARLANLSATGASGACAVLASRQLPCVVVAPLGSS